MAPEIDIHLMKIAAGVVEFVDQTGRADRDRQASLFEHFAAQVVGQGGAGLYSTAGGAHQTQSIVGIGIDQQEAVLVQQDSAGGQSGAGAGHRHTFVR